jgi:hypothetical protein
MNKILYYLTLDVASEGLKPFKRELAAIDVELTVLEEFGPGGGNPHVRLTGTKPALREALKLYSPNDQTEQLRLARRIAVVS